MRRLRRKRCRILSLSEARHVSPACAKFSLNFSGGSVSAPPSTQTRPWRTVRPCKLPSSGGCKTPPADLSCSLMSWPSPLESVVKAISSRSWSHATPKSRAKKRRSSPPLRTSRLQSISRYTRGSDKIVMGTTCSASSQYAGSKGLRRVRPRLTLPSRSTQTDCSRSRRLIARPAWRLRLRSRMTADALVLKKSPSCRRRPPPSQRRMNSGPSSGASSTVTTKTTKMTEKRRIISAVSVGSSAAPSVDDVRGTCTHHTYGYVSQHAAGPHRCAHICIHRSIHGWAWPPSFGIL
mmetsp:Transcript_10685/g.20487  ORF Transcript_10685/g.20487 Transcript_10685/m.20487 type:complete len:293 (-) Transcript_10685:333-1211(-)